MNKIKAKRLKRLAEELRVNYPTISAELDALVSGALEPIRPRQTVTATLVSAFEKLYDLLGDKLTLAGGTAILQWVDIQETEDLDFVVLPKDFEEIKKMFPEGKETLLIYYVVVDGYSIDFLNPFYFAWTKEALAQAVKKPFLGRDLKILTPEYLVLYKFEASRDKDMNHLKALLRIEGIAEKAKPLVKKYMPRELEDFEQLALEASYGL